MTKLSKLVTDLKQYAKLLNSVSQQGSGTGGKRPLSPVECAHAIKRLVEEEGESLEQVAERLNLGKPKDMSNMYKKRDTTQITMFLNLLKVSEKSRSLSGWAVDGWPSIPFSIIAQLSTMTPEEQDIIVQSVYNSDKRKILGKDDVKMIKKWKNENPNMPIKEYIEKILNLKPVTVTTHMIVVEINELLRKFVDSGPEPEKKLLGLLNTNLSGKFYDVNMGKSVLAISMNDEAYKKFHEYQYKKGLSYGYLLNEFMEKHIG